MAQRVRDYILNGGELDDIPQEDLPLFTTKLSEALSNAAHVMEKDGEADAAQVILGRME